MDRALVPAHEKRLRVLISPRVLPFGTRSFRVRAHPSLASCCRGAVPTVILKLSNPRANAWQHHVNSPKAEKTNSCPKHLAKPGWQLVEVLDGCSG